MTKIFLVLELIMKACNAWDAFMDYLNQKKKIELTEKQTTRNEAMDDLAKAMDEKAIFDAQKRVVGNKP